MLRKLTFILVFSLATFLSSTAFAGPWDIRENWDSWPSSTKIQGVRAPNEGTWGNYCSYTGGNGATSWSSSSYCYINGSIYMSAMVGTYSYSASASSYLNYTFPSPTPSANSITFYYYSYMVLSYFQCYNSSGSLLAQYTIGASTSSSYSGWMTQNVPAGTAEVRWYVSSKYSTSYSYALYVDHITMVFQTTWELYENWDTRVSSSTINGVLYPNLGTWSRYCSSSVSNGGATVWSNSSYSYTYSPIYYSAMVGTYSSSVSASSYLAYTFPSPTPLASTIRFYYYSYMVISYFQCYNSSGSLLSQTTISSSSSSSYSGWANYSVPANTSQIRWYVSSKYSTSYSYALYVDEISFKMPNNWEIFENWNSRTSTSTISGTISPNLGTWGRYCSYTSASMGGACNWSSYGHKASYTSMIGPYGTSTTATSYLSYTFPTPTPRSAEMIFYWYAYYVIAYFECYNSSGTRIEQYQLTTANNNYFSAWSALRVPAGTAQVRWYVGSMYSSSYSYSLYVDEIRFIMPLVSVDNIGGVTTGFEMPNAGIVQVTAEVSIDSSASLGSQYTDFYYRNEDGKEFYFGSDYMTGNGVRRANWDTGSKSEFGGSIIVKFNAYDNKLNGWMTYTGVLKNVFIYNPTITSFLQPNPVEGGIIQLGASFGEGPTTSGQFPPNPWTMTTSGYYSSGWYTFVNIGYTTPRAATYISYNSYFNYVPSTSGQHRIKLMTGAPTTFTVIANGNATSSVVGTQTYSLEGVTGFTNVPAGVMIGMSHMYTGTYNPTGNPTPSTYYLSSGDLTGTISLSSSNTTYGVPLTLNYLMAYPITPKIEFGFSANRVDVTSIGVANAFNGASTTEWNTEPYGNAYVYAAARAFNGNMWSGWHFSDTPINVVNYVEAEFNTSMGAGNLLFDGTSTPVSFTKTLKVSWSNIFTYKVEAPDVQLEVAQDNRWRFDNWSNGGGRSQDLMVPSDFVKAGIVPNFTANYVRQYYFTYDSPIEPLTISEPNKFYDAGVTMFGSVPQIIPDQDEPFKYRKYCTGWNETGSGLTSTRNEANFPLQGKTHLSFSYRNEISVIIHNDRGVSTGTYGGFYPLNTPVNLSVQPSMDTGTSRVNCIGYNLAPIGSGTTNSTGTFLLNQPVEITWLWEAQHFVSFAATIGTVTLVGGGNPNGWHDEGEVLNVVANKPIEPPSTQYRFDGWTGSIAGESETIAVTVNSPINATASWSTWYELVINKNGGSVNNDPSGYNRAGSPITVEAIPPFAAVGERWIIEWTGDSPAVTLPRNPDNTYTVSFNLTTPTTQNITWVRQVMLNVINTNAFAQITPPAGYNWYYPGTFVSGVAEFSTDYFICNGYEGTGSAVSSTTPFYSFVINEPTTIQWLWTPRSNVPTQFWNLPSIFEQNVGMHASAMLSDGTPIVVFYSPGSNSIYLMQKHAAGWDKTQIVSDITAVGGLDVAVSPNDDIVVAYNDSANHSLYIVKNDVLTATGKNGWAIMLIDDLGDVGRSPEIAFNDDGSFYIGYIDAANGKVKVALVNGGVVEIETVPTNAIVSMFASISVKKIDHLPVVAFYDSAARALMVSTRTGEGWNTELVDNNGIVGLFCKVSASISGGIMVAYQDITNSNNPTIKFARKSADTWSIETIYAKPSGFNLDFVIDHNYNAHIVSNDGSKLHYLRRLATTWEAIEIPRPSGVNGRVSLIVLPVGKPAVIYSKSDDLGYMDALANSLVNTDDSPIGDDDDDDDDDDPTPGGAGGGGGCFIATAAFGSLSANSVAALTATRDGLIAASLIGENLVSTYYIVSPYAAHTVRANESLSLLVRSLLQ